MLDVIINKERIRMGERFAVSFHRTLRIPDDGRTYPLPPGLGVFPLYRVMDYRERVPKKWLEHGGAFIPMYQREALWLGFSGAWWKPNAVKIDIGGFNSLSGKPDQPGLQADPQDYLVCPDQPWLDGFNTGRGSIRQFLAMPLGLGYTMEAALRGEETLGGIQITVFEPNPGVFPDQPPDRKDDGRRRPSLQRMGKPAEMGLGGGGTIRQKIYPDPYGLATWNQDTSGRVVIFIINSQYFHEITGEPPPTTPIDAQTYTEHGLPWFDLYDEERGDVSPSAELTQAKTVADRDAELGKAREPSEGFDAPESQVKKIYPMGAVKKNNR
jgi:hypothetical protein